MCESDRERAINNERSRHHHQIIISSVTHSVSRSNLASIQIPIAAECSSNHTTYPKNRVVERIDQILGEE